MAWKMMEQRAFRAPFRTKRMALMGLFDDRTSAERGLSALEGLGVPKEDLSVLAHGVIAPEAARDVNGTIAIPAELTVTLVGIVLCAIPLAGLLTAGPLAVLGGAASLSRTGNPVDDLADIGVPREDAKIAHEHLRRGGIVVVALCERPLVRRAAEALASAGAVDFRRRAVEWEDAGWDYEPNAPMWPTERVFRESLPSSRLRGRQPADLQPGDLQPPPWSSPG